MGEGFDPERADADDVASMVAELQVRLDRETLARALGVTRSELDLIAAGYTPEPRALERLRLLYDLASRVEDLGSPEALAATLGLPAAPGSTLPLALMPRLKTFLVAFVVLDALVFAGVVVAYVLLR